MKKLSSLVIFSFITILLSSFVIIAANPSVVLTPLSPTTICATGNDTLLYSVNASNIPANTNVVIYQSTDSTFNPSLGQGDSIGFVKGDTSSTGGIITSTCPKILGIFIDACNDSGRLEPANEYMVITSGQGFRVANLKVDVPNTNLRDINTGSNPCSFGTPSNTLMSLLRTGFCNSSNLLAASQADSIPPDAIVIIFTGAGTDYPYNLSRFCQTGQKIYILQNACTYGSGAFVNNDAAGTTCTGATPSTRYRTTSIANRNCFDELTYDRCGLNEFDGANPNANDGNYVIRLQTTDTSSVANGGIQNNSADRCNGVVLDSIIKIQTLKFAIPTAFCNTGMHYIKAVLKPQTQPFTISNTIQFNYICNDVRATSSTTNICSGDSAIINISSTDPNATFSWTISGGTGITGATSGSGNTIKQKLTYTGTTNSNITYNITSNDAGCTKTTSVSINVRNCINVVDTVTICSGDSIQICGPEGYDNYTWTPTTGLSNNKSRCTFAKPTTTTKYNIEASNNLIVIDTVELVKNGSFEDSMNFWNTDLFLLTPSCGGCNGWFYIGNSTYCNNPDHTINGVKLFNSSPTADTSKRVLYQTISVNKNTNYKFSAWGYAHNSNNAIFNVKINNDVVVNNYALSAIGCVGWENFTGTWYSGNNTTANIVIKDYRAEIVGNDFSLDDISLRKILDTSLVSDSIIVVVKNCDTCNLTTNITGNLSFCAGGSTALSVQSQYDSIRWNTGATSSSINVSQAGTYSVLVYKDACSARASVNVVSITPSVSISGNTSICGGSSTTLTAIGQFDSLRWNTGATSTSIDVSQAGSYTVTSYINGCATTATTVVQSNSVSVSISGNTSICNGSFTALTAVGQFDSVRWNTGEGSTVINTNQSGTYSVTAYANGCSGTASVNVVNGSLNVNIKGNLTICNNGTTIISVEGGQFDSVRWNIGSSTPEITISQPGTYSVTAYSNGCSGTASANVGTINVTPTISGGDLLCGGTSVTLTTSGIFDSIRWNNNATTTSINVTQQGTYSVTAYSSGCSGLANFNVAQISIDYFLDKKTDTICTGDTAKFVLLAGDLIASPVDTFTFTQPGRYQISYNTPNCGLFIDSVVVVGKTINNPTITGNLTICSGLSTTTLDAGANYDSYSWQPTAETAQTITVNNAGTYTVTVTKGNCSASNSVIVSAVNPLPTFSLGNDTAFCGTINKVLSTGNQNTVWSNGTTASQINITEAGQYIATITNACGFVSDTIVISQNPTPNVNLGNDTAFCDGEITLAINSSQNVRNIIWSTGEQTATILVNSIGTYSVKVTNTSGCSDSDAITLSSNCANEIWLPNAFTPDGNGINDVFYVRGNPQNTVIERFVIYNRWGNKVFEASNILPDDKTKGWNGTYKNVVEQLEVYGYEVVAKFANGEKRTLKGNVTLLK